MKTNLTIKNFRIFDPKQGATFRLTPLTLLTGCNSSGKSSVVKAILLLRDFFEQMQIEKFYDCKLNFGNTLAKLGKFDLVRNNGSRKGSKMSFAYQIFSKHLGEEVEVVLTFAADSKDALNDGWLSDIVIKKQDGTTIFDAFMDREAKQTILNQGGPEKLQIRCNNLLAIKENYLSFVLKSLGKDALYRYRNSSSGSDYATAVADYIKRLSQHLSEAGITSFQEELKAEIDTFFFRSLPELHNWSAYEKHESLYFQADDLGTLFPMPIWGAIAGVKKCDVRNTFINWIAQAEAHNKANGIDLSLCSFEHKDLLDDVLDSFEASEYDTLLSFFIAKENEWLQEVPLQAKQRELSTVKAYSKIADFAKYPKVMDEYYFGKMEGVSFNSQDPNYTIEEICNFDKSNFGDLFQLLHKLNKFVASTYLAENYDYIKTIEGFNGLYDEHVHLIFDSLREYYGQVMLEILSPATYKAFEYVADAAILPKRVYTREQEDLFGGYLFEYLDVVRTFKPIRNIQDDSMVPNIMPGDFINKWIKAFEIGDHLSITNTAEGLGVVVKLHKRPDDKKGVLLADEGLGITKLIGTLIYIELNILKAKGHAVTLAIEEPENHLHPKFQSLLAEVFAEAYKEHNIHFIVETHSEYIIRKLQGLVAKRLVTPEEISLQYVYNQDVEKRPKGEPQVKDIGIRDNGFLMTEFGPGFLDEADNLVMDILTSYKPKK